ncbi:MAG: hypothetical protein SAK29_24730, partial [Scytonema sp. PMC 1069.18]|nr:hypothetical protein [Scytonema sp. PMC 1069.18]MEC4887979.1 hypothetical protein [Scytonema sp. PMC 1070.18]
MKRCDSIFATELSPVSTLEPQWFILHGWLDSQEWGDEPPDPDDVWAVGDRVRLKNATVEGTVLIEEKQSFLGGYLPYVLILWDNKTIPIPIEPELLVRLTRFIPKDLTWKAEQSFSDELENDSVEKSGVVHLPFQKALATQELQLPFLARCDSDEELLGENKNNQFEFVRSARAEGRKFLKAFDSTDSEKDSAEVDGVSNPCSPINQTQHERSRSKVKSIPAATSPTPKAKFDKVQSPSNSSPSKSQDGTDTDCDVYDGLYLRNPCHQNHHPKKYNSGSIHWRTLTKNGKDYPQAHYHWKENGHKRTRYIPKRLLGVVIEAKAAKRPVIEILRLLGVVTSPSKLLGDKEVSPSHQEVLSKKVSVQGVEGRSRTGEVLGA